MKIRVVRRILIILMIITLVSITVSYVGYLKYNVSNKNNNAFRERLFSTIYEEKTFTMEEVTSFEWDKMFVFEPYLSRDFMESVTGSEWTNANSYLEYLYQRSSLDEFPLLDETYYKLVFINNDKVVLDITLERYNINFLQMKELVNNHRTNLIIKKEETNKYIIEKSE